jgi:hypothetical protein
MVGEYRASIATLLLDPKDVRRMLPAGLDLGPPAQECPVFFGFGRHHGVTLTHLEWLPIFPMAYEETFIGVPGLSGARVGAGDGPYHYVSRLFLNRFLPTLGGNLIWGFTKRMASIRVPRRDDTFPYAVRSLLRRRPYYRLEASPIGDFLPSSSFPNFKYARRRIDQPLIEKLFFQLGPFASSLFTWNWKEAKIRPLKTSVRVQTAFLPGLRPGVHDSLGIDEDRHGSFEACVSWSLSLPDPCFSTPAPGTSRARRGRQRIGLAQDRDDVRTTRTST